MLLPLFWILLEGSETFHKASQNVLWGRTTGCLQHGQLDNICNASPIFSIPVLSFSHLLAGITLEHERLLHKPLFCGNPGFAFAFRETGSTFRQSQANSEPARRKEVKYFKKEEMPLHQATDVTGILMTANLWSPYLLSSIPKKDITEHDLCVCTRY